MLNSNRFGSRTVGLPTIGGALILVALLATSAPVHAQYAVPPIDEGQTYFMATHSFSTFIAPNRETGEFGPLDKLAAEAELAGHRNVGIQLVDGSAPLQHWNQGNGDDSRNEAKVALRGGGVGVLAISPNAEVPEQGLDLFADLLAETNPAGRLLVQTSWSPWDGGTEQSEFSNEDHDRADVETIQGWIDGLRARGGYLDRLREQIAGINQRAGRDIAYLVPAADAVYRLRQEVQRGRIPGLDRQSELFVDGMGHPATPVVNLVSYVWFTVMYRQPASGLTALMDPNDPTSAERERLLQQIAWEAAALEPISGVTASILWPDGARSMHDLLHDMGPEGDMPMEH